MPAKAAQWRADRVERLSAVRGANYLPSWSRSAYDAWGIRMEREQLARELGYATSLGFDAIRVWLALDEHGDVQAFVSQIGVLLDAAYACGLTVVLVLFDSCGCKYESDAKQIRVETLPALASPDPRWRQLTEWAGDRDLVGPHELIQTPWVGDPMAVIWNTWRPMPAYGLLLDPAGRRDRREYVEAILTTAAGHPALLAAELVNEPFLSPAAQGLDVAPVVQLYQDCYELAREVAPSVPLGIGAADATDAVIHDGNLDGELDFVSTHCYGDADELRAEVTVARNLAGGRPVVLSEWGCFPGLADEQHEQVYRHRAVALRELDVAWFAFHLVAGYGPFALSALIYPNGTMRPAARFLREHLCP